MLRGRQRGPAPRRSRPLAGTARRSQDVAPGPQDFTGLQQFQALQAERGEGGEAAADSDHDEDPMSRSTLTAPRAGQRAEQADDEGAQDVDEQSAQGNCGPVRAAIARPARTSPCCRAPRPALPRSRSPPVLHSCYGRLGPRWWPERRRWPGVRRAFYPGSSGCSADGRLPRWGMLGYRSVARKAGSGVLETSTPSGRYIQGGISETAGMRHPLQRGGPPKRHCGIV